jgi:hypothetical protein
MRGVSWRLLTQVWKACFTIVDPSAGSVALPKIKSTPQRLKPKVIAGLTARLKSCPSRTSQRRRRTARRRPRTARRQPRTARLQPRTARLQPRTARLQPRTARLQQLPLTDWPHTVPLTVQLSEEFIVYVALT